MSFKSSHYISVKTRIWLLRTFLTSCICGTSIQCQEIQTTHIMPLVAGPNKYMIDTKFILSSSRNNHT